MQTAVLIRESSGQRIADCGVEVRGLQTAVLIRESSGQRIADCGVDQRTVRSEDCRLWC